MEQFFTSVFEHAPAGSFFYAATIFKQIRKAFPKFYSDPALLIADAKAHRETDQPDFYFSPAFYFRKTKAIKSNVRGAGVAWVDCDTGLPEFEQEPNFILETSPGHFHCYWLLGEMRKPDEVEAINRTLAYRYNTDKSGWDSTQLLRPSGSYNRKRDNFRTRIERTNLDTRADFSGIAVGDYRPVDTESTATGGGNTVESLLAELVLTKRDRDLIFHATDTTTGEGRSGVIFNLACNLVKQGLKDTELLMLLELTDLRLGKFKDHADRNGVLRGVIKSAREKEKTAEPIAKKSPFRIYSSEELQTVVLNDRFLCQNLVFEEGITVIGGEPAAGKSRFALNMVDCLACGAEFIGFETGDPIVCCYMTIDMSARRLRGIREQQMAGFNSEQRALIHQNVKIVDIVPGTNLVKPETQAEAADIMQGIGAKFFVIDAISRAIPDMSNDEQVVPFLSWLQRYIADSGASFGLVTHTRKGQVGNKTANSLDDWYGSRHWSITPDTGFVLENLGGRGYNSALHINKDRSGELGQKIIVKKDYGTSLHTLVTSEAPITEDKAGIDLSFGGKM